MYILLAGMESKKSLEMAVKHNVKGVLVSAFYMKKKSKSHLDFIYDNFDFILIDSGAYTFKARWKSRRQERFKELYGEENWEEYYGNHEKYMEWRDTPEADRMWQQILTEVSEWEEEFKDYLDTDKRFKDKSKFRIAELDVGNLELRLERQKRFKKRGHKVFPVLQESDDKEYSMKIIRENEYMGIGDLVASGSKYTVADFNLVFREAKKWNTKIHGFGMTTQDPMIKSPFFSVDSTSWLSGARFGTTYEFKNGQLKVYDGNNKKIRQQFRDACKEHEIDYEKLVNDDSMAVNEWNLVQWNMYSEWLTKSPMKKKQEYWHDLVNGGEKQKKIEYDKEGNVTDVEILNSKGEPIDLEKQRDAMLPSVKVEEFTPTEQVLANKVADGVYMECDSCIMGDRCPLYKENSICRIPTEKIEGASDFAEMLKFMFTLQQKRIKLGALQESANGGILDDKLSKELDRLMKLMQGYKDLMDNRDEVTIKAKGNGILSQIFGNAKRDD